MKLSSKELKRLARERLTGHYGLPMGAFVMTQLIVVLISFPFNLSLQTNPNSFQMMISSLATLFISLLSLLLSSGLLYIHLNLARGNKSTFSDLFRFFTLRPDRFLLAGLMLMGIMLLVIIPALICTAMLTVFHFGLWYVLTLLVWVVTFVSMFILAYSYSLIFYLLIDHPEEGLINVFKESRRLMKGNRGRLFYISFSFIGMTLLSILSLGIGYLWVSPYISQTNVEFYLNVIGESEVYKEEAVEF